MVWAEDSDSDRFLIREALEGTPFQANIAFAADGHEALRELAKGRPTGVVLDINMPNMDGVTALRKIRERHGDVPVIMFSTSNDPAEVLACRELGVVAYAVKPVDYNSFRIVVTGIVSQFQGTHGTRRGHEAFVARLRPRASSSSLQGH